MHLQRLEVRSFCGQSRHLWLLVTEWAAQVCERCAVDMQSAASHDRNRQASEYMRQSNLLEEWLLVMVPVTVFLIGITFDGGSVLTPILQAFGVTFVVEVICLNS
jgi:hypothetical protein